MSKFKISQIVLNYGIMLFVPTSIVLVYAYYYSPTDEEIKRKIISNDPDAKRKAEQSKQDFQIFFNKFKTHSDKDQQDTFDKLIKNGISKTASTKLEDTLVQPKVILEVENTKIKDIIINEKVATACDDVISKFESDPKLSKLLLGFKSKNKSNTKLPIIQCKPCSNDGAERSAKAYTMDSKPNKIILCTNRQSTDEEFHTSLIHELVHVYDMNILKLKLSNCEDLARSEVRAAREAECRNHYFDVLKVKCIRNQAINSTNNMFPTKGKECVNAVFEEALRDKRPFEIESSNK